MAEGPKFRLDSPEARQRAEELRTDIGKLLSAGRSNQYGIGVALAEVRKKQLYRIQPDGSLGGKWKPFLKPFEIHPTQALMWIQIATSVTPEVAAKCHLTVLDYWLDDLKENQDPIPEDPLAVTFELDGKQVHLDELSVEDAAFLFKDIPRPEKKEKESEGGHGGEGITKEENDSVAVFQMALGRHPASYRIRAIKERGVMYVQSTIKVSEARECYRKMADAPTSLYPTSNTVVRPDKKEKEKKPAKKEAPKKEATGKKGGDKKPRKQPR